VKEKLDRKTKDELLKKKIQFVRFKNKYYIKYSKDESGGEKSIFNSGTLKTEDINLLKKIGFKKYSISEMVPFAPFIFIGVLITYLLGETLISFVVNLLQ